MKRLYALLLIVFSLGYQSFSQMYILNEDFSGASGTVPPAGWTNYTITGTADDLWHFDNPGNRLIDFPVIAPFAIFDSEEVSPGTNPEEAALETPLFDASISNFILLHFHQTLDPGAGGTARVEAYDGDNWHIVKTYTLATQNPSSEIVDLSAITGGVTNARLRFVWSGNGSGFWAVDNIRIYASQPLDCGVVSVDHPTSPVAAGVQNVEITLGNFGYNTITSATIHWTANGVAQPSYDWNGNIGFGQIAGDIAIGTYDFQDAVLLKVWQTNPNGMPDPNPFNDTITKYVQVALCGTYTIGGSNPDFGSLSEAVTRLNAAGITCPVTFLVRDGLYYEQFILRNIPGASPENRVMFRSESGDSTQAVIRIMPAALKYDPMILMYDASHVTFRQLGLFTGAASNFNNYAVIIDGGHDIVLEQCYFEIRNQYDVGLVAKGGTHSLSVRNNRFEPVSPRITAISISGNTTREIEVIHNQIRGGAEWGQSAIIVESGAKRVNITGNSLWQCYRAMYITMADSVTVRNNVIQDVNFGVHTDNQSNNIEISGNRITGVKHHQNAPDGTSGILISKTQHADLFNNFIHTTGDGLVNGISLQTAAESSVNFNSVNVTNRDAQGRSKGIYLKESIGTSARNNIFHVKYAGIPVYFETNTLPVDFDRNNYFSFDRTIGYFNGIRHTDLAAWIIAVGTDPSSMSYRPFYSSDTDLSMNQILLNNTGVPVAGIDRDIDGTLRHSSYPDPGAKEYDPCAIDAGINGLVSPQNPLGGGVEQVRALLTNQGTATLTSAKINWQVNSEPQASYTWSGNLTSGQSQEVTIGTYDFHSGILYTLKLWTSEPNNTSDCNHANDTITTGELAAPLCGTYTVGGDAPDFISLSQAATVLNLAGIDCPVTFLVRDGLYYEQFNLKAIPGSSPVNGITFRSESGDSSNAIIRIIPEAMKFETMIYLQGTQNVSFKDLSFVTGSNVSFNNNALLMSGVQNISFENCYFEARKEADLSIGVLEGSSQIRIRNSRFEVIVSRAYTISVEGGQTRDIEITGNTIRGASDWNYSTLKIGKYVSMVNISGNYIERGYRAVHILQSDSVTVSGNRFDDVNHGVYIDDWSNHIIISANRMTRVKHHPDDQDGTHGIYANNSTQLDIFNNYIHTMGQGIVSGITLQKITGASVNFNSVNVTNQDFHARSKGIHLLTSSQVVVRNNIFNISHAGIPMYITSMTPPFDLNHNNYSSFDESIGFYNGNLYTDLGAWRDSLGMDAGSLSANPFFTTDTELSMNQILLNNAGTPVAGVADDIDGTLRHPVTPDIGAKEYAPCAVDAGINAILGPVNPLSGGSAQLRVRLINQGSAALTMVNINWQVNGQSQTPFQWTGNLASGAATDITAGTFEYQPGLLYILRAWTSDPNNTEDCNLANDTVISRKLAGPLCGVYTIGGQEADFENVGDAVSALNLAGITCPVTFVIRDGTYYEQFRLNPVVGSSAEKPVKFTSESGNNTDAVIRIAPGAIKFESMINLYGASHITFQDIGLYTGATAGNANIAVTLEGAKDIVFDGCYFEVRKESDLALVIQGGSRNVTVSRSVIDCIDFRAGAVRFSGAGTQGITFTGNIIRGHAYRANVLFRIGSQTRRITLEDNHISRCYRAVYMIEADSVRISHNFIDDMHEGIYIDNNCKNIEILANRFLNVRSHQNSPDGTNGVFARNTTNLDLINNFVHTRGEGPVHGFQLQNIDTLRLHFNSINTTNTDAQGKSNSVVMKNCNVVTGRNNILHIKSTGTPFNIEQQGLGFSLDYNNYSHPQGMIGKIGGQAYSDLYQWGQLLSGDANSKTVNPFFKADTIPLPFQRALNGAGIPLTGILFDIDGKLRFSQAPDIGCLEFFVDYGVLELLSPTLDCYHPDVDSVIVYIRQFGDVPFADLKVAYQMDNGPVHIDTIPGPLYEDVIHTFATTENISTYGDYLFKIWLINTLDDNINNDTLKAMRYSKPSPEVSMSWDNFCTGWTVLFSGQATVVSPYTIAGYEWLFGDGGVSYEQNPVHAYQEPGTYEVALRAYSDAGCYSEVIRQVFIDPEFLGLSSNYNIIPETCYGDGNGSLEILAFGGYPPYTYYVSGNSIDGNFIAGFPSGVHEIYIVDSENCTFTDTIISLPAVYLDPQIMAEPVAGHIPLTVHFDFTANDPATWTWYFTPADSSDSQAPSFTFTEYGNHQVILEVRSGHPHYCTETAVIDIFVDIIVTIEANNVFTPNDDGYNDYFEVRTTGIQELRVNIFNTWGNIVYRIEEVDGKWDGRTSGGAKAPDGTYFYYIEAKGYDGKTYTRQGSVLLLRHAAEAYPNPVRGKLKISASGPLSAPVSYAIYSLYGQLVASGLMHDPENLILDLTGMTNGIYFIRIYDDSRNYFVRIIKN